MKKVEAESANSSGVKASLVRRSFSVASLLSICTYFLFLWVLATGCVLDESDLCCGLLALDEFDQVVDV